jgi:hypothetical protein
METLEQLVADRRGYKYLSKTGVSPYQSYQYDLKSKKQMKSGGLDHDINNACGEGWNLATLKWIADNCMKIDGVIAECSIPPKAVIVVPKESGGKFRTDIIKIKRVHDIECLFPALKDINKRLKAYKPINPIIATTMPDVVEIKKIMASVGASVRASVWDSVWGSVWGSVWDSVRDSVRASVNASVGASVGASVWAPVLSSVWGSVRASVRASVWDSVWGSVWDSVRASVGNYSYLCGYLAIKEFFNLDYEHPVFDLIRMGVIVVKVRDKYMVFGKDGVHLGDIDV